MMRKGFFIFYFLGGGVGFDPHVLFYQIQHRIPDVKEFNVVSVSRRQYDWRAIGYSTVSHIFKYGQPEHA